MAKCREYRVHVTIRLRRWLPVWAEDADEAVFLTQHRPPDDLLNNFEVEDILDIEVEEVQPI